ncbi:MAG: anti-sigma factor [Pseudonocardia sp.]
MNGAGEACRWNEQAAAHAWHALDAEEDAALRAHLPDCAWCRAIVAETEDVAAAMAGSVEQVDPPPRLRERILAEVARTPQVPSGTGTETGADGGDTARPTAGDPAPGTAAGPGDTARPTAGDPAAGTDRGRARGARPAGVSRPAAGPGRRRRRLVAAALALATLVAVLGGLVAYTVQVQRERDAQVVQARALAELLVALDQPGTSHATLATESGDPVGVVVTTATSRAVVTAGLPANDRSATVYVLWGVGSATPQPIGTFDVAGTAPTVHEVDSPGREPPFAGYAISLEPGRQAPATPTTVVATGAVPS